MSNFYQHYLDLCNNKGVTPSRAALDMHISKTSVTRWKQGYMPTDANLQKIANYFDVSTDYLLGKTEQKEKPLGIEELTVFNMEGVEGAHTVRVNMNNFKQINDLINELRDLPPEKIEALIQLIKTMK